MNFKGGLLLDESVNLGDISTSSFGTPLPVKGAPDFDDSSIYQPRLTVEDEEIDDGEDVAPPSPLDDEVPVESAEVDKDSPPPSLSERDHPPTPRDSEPHTPSRRTEIQITMETEGIVVSTQRPLVMICWLTLSQGKDLGHRRRSYTTRLSIPRGRQVATCERDDVCSSSTPFAR